PANAHVDLATAAAAAVREAAPMAQQKAQTLRNLVRDEAPGIWGDGRSIRQTIGSLIDNACKFGPEGGEILLSGARLPGGEFRLTVEDAGPGFPATLVAELTEAFRQGDDDIGRAFEGVGLGRYLARQTMA
ncbi:MAG: ATP-binding protein, partial [Alphaproteobacteria bacterium]